MFSPFPRGLRQPSLLVKRRMPSESGNPIFLSLVPAEGSLFSCLVCVFLEVPDPSERGFLCQGQGECHRCVTRAVAQGPVLRGSQCCISCSIVATWKFLILFEIGAWCFILAWTHKLCPSQRVFIWCIALSSMREGYFFLHFSNWRTTQRWWLAQLPAVRKMKEEEEKDSLGIFILMWKNF